MYVFLGIPALYLLMMRLYPMVMNNKSLASTFFAVAGAASTILLAPTAAEAIQIDLSTGETYDVTAFFGSLSDFRQTDYIGQP
ncbi:hypothetical protein C7271_02645 [filamentous cyanobacterium CCP5]|nr:hypothetical protein C7271_02645 [filamentous cyanobacterium CCP5]